MTSNISLVAILIVFLIRTEHCASKINHLDSAPVNLYEKIKGVIDSNNEDRFVYNNEIEFIFVNNLLPWSHAKYYCEDVVKGKLALIKSYDVAYFIGEALSVTNLEMNHLWIGAERDRGEIWHWTDGSKFEPLQNHLLDYFHVRRKNIVGLSRNCLSLIKKNHKIPLYVDLNCNTFRPFICEKNSTLPIWKKIDEKKATNAKIRAKREAANTEKEDENRKKRQKDEAKEDEVEESETKKYEAEEKAESKDEKKEKSKENKAEEDEVEESHTKKYEAEEKEESKKDKNEKNEVQESETKKYEKEEKEESNDEKRDKSKENKAEEDEVKESQTKNYEAEEKAESKDEKRMKREEDEARKLRATEKKNKRKEDSSSSEEDKVEKSKNKYPLIFKKEDKVEKTEDTQPIIFKLFSFIFN